MYFIIRVQFLSIGNSHGVRNPGLELSQCWLVSGLPYWLRLYGWNGELCMDAGMLLALAAFALFERSDHHEEIYA
jgi:hypothetical protein